MTVLRYIAADWSKAVSAARFLCSKVPASKTVCVAVPITVQKAVPACQISVDLVGGSAGTGGESKRRQYCGDSDTDRGTRGMQLRRGRLHVRTLCDELRRQAERQLQRQLQ